MPRSRQRIGFLLIALVWMAVFVWTARQSGARFPLYPLPATALVQAGALSLPLPSTGASLRIFSAWLIHVDSLHLLTNLTVLGLVAWAWPAQRLVVGPLVSGLIASGFASCLAHREVATICAGGSGVLLALLPTAVAGAPHRLAAALSLCAGVLLFAAGLVPPGDWAAHVGGLLVGLLWLGAGKARA